MPIIEIAIRDYRPSDAFTHAMVDDAVVFLQQVVNLTGRQHSWQAPRDFGQAPSQKAYQGIRGVTHVVYHTPPPK
jgi:hypothetical protein